MDNSINKMCRICLEEGVFTSLFTTEFQMMPADMIMLCAKVKVFKNDGMPGVICNNCIYRLGIAYHFKQQCENSDIRLKQYLGIMEKGYWARDATTMTEETEKEKESCDKCEKRVKTHVKQSRYKRKMAEDIKKRGPKPAPKVPQTCFQCNKTFKCLAQLQMHIRTHTGERPFSCTYCPRRFAQKHNLSIHMRTHTGEKPFQCEICSKQFSALGNFQAHKKIHSGVRDQICPACNKSFISSSDLSRHMITHTGIKNFHCDTCGKAFSRNRDMISHKKKVHSSSESRTSGGSGGGGGDTTNSKCSECLKVYPLTPTVPRILSNFKDHVSAPIPIQPSVSPPVNVMSVLPAAPTALGGNLGVGPSSLIGGPSGLGVGLGLHHPASAGLGYSPGNLSILHSQAQRLHPY